MLTEKIEQINKQINEFELHVYTSLFSPPTDQMRGTFIRLNSIIFFFGLLLFIAFTFDKNALKLR